MTTFEQIPDNALEPIFADEVKGALDSNTLSTRPHKILSIATKSGDGTWADGTLIRVTNIGAAELGAGVGSPLCEMLRSIMVQRQFGLDIWAYAETDDAGGGTAASGDVFTFTGTATEAGNLYLYIAGYRFVVPVAVGDDAADCETAAVAAIQAHPHYGRLPCEVAGAGAATAVEATAKAEGTWGNRIQFDINLQSGEFLPVGIGCTVSALTNGATDPDLSSEIPDLGDERFDTIVYGGIESDNLAALVTEAERRWNDISGLETHVYVGLAAVHATLISAGEARNSKNLTICGFPPQQTPAWELAAATAAECAFKSVNLPPNRPRQNIPLKNVRIQPRVSDQFSYNERQLLLEAGVGTFKALSTSEFGISALCTTYKTNASGANDPTFRYVEYMRALQYARFDWRNLWKTKYPDALLADRGTIVNPGVLVVTPDTAVAEALSRYRLWVAAGIFERFEDFKEGLISDRSQLNLERLDNYLPVNAMNSLRIVATQFGFSP